MWGHEPGVKEKDQPPQSAPSVDTAWAWKPYEPDARHPWDLRKAGHLLRRAGFGATWKELQQALADGPQRTIDRLLQAYLPVEIQTVQIGEAPNTDGDARLLLQTQLRVGKTVLAPGKCFSKRRMFFTSAPRQP